MNSRRPRVLLATAIVAGTVAASLTVPALSASATGTPERTTTLCRALQRMTVTGPKNATFILRNDNYGHEPECLTNRNGRANFTVSASGARSAGSESMAYPEIMLGCAWGLCTPGTTLPMRTTSLRGLRSSWYITAKASGIWNAGWDLWFDHHDNTSGQDSGGELMVWLRWTLPENPDHARLVRIRGVRYWLESWMARSRVTGARWPYVLFRRYRPVSHVRDLRLDPFIKWAQRAGLLHKHLWLTSIDAGFEIWKGGKGLATDQYWVSA